MWPAWVQSSTSHGAQDRNNHWASQMWPKNRNSKLKFWDTDYLTQRQEWPLSTTNVTQKQNQNTQLDSWHCVMGGCTSLKILCPISLPNRLVRLVTDEEASSLQLYDVTFPQVFKAGISKHKLFMLCRKSQTDVLKIRAPKPTLKQSTHVPPSPSRAGMFFNFRLPY